MSPQSTPIYAFGPFRLDVAERLLVREGHPLRLTPKAFDLLRVLVENAGHLVEKDLLLQAVWPDTYVDEANLNRSISILRRVLDDGSPDARYIETVPTRGYRFVAPVSADAQQAAPSAAALVPHTSDGRRADHATSASTPASLLRAVATGPALRMVAVAGGVLLTVMVIALMTLGSRRNTPHRAASVAPNHRQVTFTGKEGTPTISPDGTLVAYVSHDGPDQRVVVHELANGQTLEVFRAPEAGSLRWSPDGSELLFWARGSGNDGVFVVSRLGGAHRKVSGRLANGCWSPDGLSLALGGIGEVMFVDRQSGGRRLVGFGGPPHFVADLDWASATGLVLAVVGDGQGGSAIWTLHPDGTDRDEVVKETTEITAARWSPRGDSIYYFRRANQTLTLMKAQVSSGRTSPAPDATPLIAGLEADGALALSADGSRLTYARAPHFSNLWLAALDPAHPGSRMQTRALTQGTALIERPRVSPDGETVVFNMGHPPLANLYTLPIVGGSPSQLTFLNAFSLEGVWAPNGREVAFASTHGGSPKVWVVSVDGGTPRPLSTGEMSDSFELAWIPGHILYQQTGTRNFYVLDPRTHEEQMLVADASVGWLFSPVVSPDGERLAVAWSRQAFGIWVIERRTAVATRIYGASIPTPIGWSADGASIYAIEGKRAAYRGPPTKLGETITDARILKLPVRGGAAETVATLPFGEIGGVSITPDGRALICAVYSSRSDVWVVENFDRDTEPRAGQ